MAEKIKRYDEHDGLDPNGAYVRFSDLESYVQTKVAEERERCREQEVGPALMALRNVIVAASICLNGGTKS